MVSTSATPFPTLFSRAHIGPLVLRNRILMAPMEKNLAGPDGSVTQRYIEYVAERARGGAALINLESMYVDPVGRNHVYQLGLHDDRLLPGYRRLLEAAQAHGALLGAEIQFAGRETSSAVTGFQPVAPSPVPCAVLAGGEVPRQLTVPEIRRIVARFAEAADRAARVGFHLVEVHGAHGYLVGQFLSPYSNRRTDEYGGDAERRMRFPLEVVGAVREALAGRAALAYRISADEYVDGGLRIEDVLPFCQRLEAAGVQLIDVSAAIYESAVMIAQPMEQPPGCLAHLSRAIRQRVRIPVSVAGRINDPAVAEAILQEGQADFVTLGRALHADPEFPAKARGGRQDAIRPCVACLKCSDLLGANLPVSCLVNPAAAREREYALRPAARPLRVLVVGGGPAGLEAARVAALRGHCVTLWERGHELGGQVRWMRRIPGRQEMAGLIASLERAIKEAGVRVELGREGDAAAVLAERPEAVVVATGAAAAIPPIPGIEDGPVVSPFDVLRREGSLGRRVLIIGGQIIGVSLAHLLADRGAEVILAEPGGALAADLGFRARWQPVEDLRRRDNVAVHLHATVEAIRGDGATLRVAGEVLELERLDAILPARTLVAAGALAQELRRAAPDLPLFDVGDAVTPRTAYEAMHEGAAAGRAL
ncbi:MAG TPA: FAD-dependent oxidoreductase [Candidatus Sulfotelmatobacter sp.]|nr:FAD-dependent oxidoreductase [Candidatus Sulfotelmatobacter sp.]